MICKISLQWNSGPSNIFKPLFKCLELNENTSNVSFAYKHFKSIQYHTTLQKTIKQRNKRNMYKLESLPLAGFYIYRRRWKFTYFCNTIAFFGKINLFCMGNSPNKIFYCEKKVSRHYQISRIVKYPMVNGSLGKDKYSSYNWSHKL